jgi:hypothetical protein
MILGLRVPAPKHVRRKRKGFFTPPNTPDLVQIWINSFLRGFHAPLDTEKTAGFHCSRFMNARGTF